MASQWQYSVIDYSREMLSIMVIDNACTKGCKDGAKMRFEGIFVASGSTLNPPSHWTNNPWATTTPISNNFKIKDQEFRNTNSGIGITVNPNPMALNSIIEISGLNAETGSNFLIYDLSGNKIREISFTTNTASIDWDGEDDSGSSVSSGLYVLSIQNGNSHANQMIMVRDF